MLFAFKKLWTVRFGTLKSIVKIILAKNEAYFYSLSTPPHQIKFFFIINIIFFIYDWTVRTFAIEIRKGLAEFRPVYFVRVKWISVRNYSADGLFY